MDSKRGLSFARVVSGVDSTASPPPRAEATGVSAGNVAVETNVSRNEIQQTNAVVSSERKEKPEKAQQGFQTHYHGRRNRPSRYVNDRDRIEKKIKDESVTSKPDESESSSPVPAVVLGPAPVPAVNAWFRNSKSKENANENSNEALPLKTEVKDQLSDEKINSGQNTELQKNKKVKQTSEFAEATSTGSKTDKSSNIHDTSEFKPVATAMKDTIGQVDEKAWPSLNAALTEETKAEPASVQQSHKNNSRQGSPNVENVVGHTTLQEPKKEKEVGESSNANNGLKSSRSGKNWKKLDIDVDYTGREGQSRRANINAGKGDQQQYSQRNRRGTNIKQTGKENISISLSTSNPGNGTENTSEKLSSSTLQSNTGPSAPGLHPSPNSGNADHNDEYVEENYW
uniref:HTH La-type RNA-binding domain-containing protein n=1 Tax=Syphacia muris TaxID=451379 RepID=A0A0N5AB56_9BILA